MTLQNYRPDNLLLQLASDKAVCTIFYITQIRFKFVLISHFFGNESLSLAIFTEALIFVGQCENYNVTSRRPCNDTSRMNLSGYAGCVTIFICMFTIACCLVVGLGLGLGLGVDLVSGWCNFRL